MFRVAWKSVLGNKLRLAMTGVAIVIGVAFVSGTFVLTDSIQRAFDGLFEGVNEGIDGYVSPVTDIELTFEQQAPGGPVPTMHEDVLDVVADVDGVALAQGFLETTFAQIVDGEGEPVGQAQGPPKLGFNWTENDGSPIVLREGRAPEGPGEVVIDRVSADMAGFELGDTVRVITVSGANEFELVGIVGFGEEDNFLGATIASFETDVAQDLFNLEDQFTQIALEVEEGRVVEDVLDDVRAAVSGEDVEVVTAADQQQQDQQEITEFLGFFNIALLSFAGIALFVGSFLIFNTFMIIVAQRAREFALLRAVGATAGQIQRVVMVEAFVVALLASTVGLVGGIVFGQLLQLLFDAIGFGLPDGGLVVKPRTIVSAYTVGIVATMFAALYPAYRTSKVTPVEAMRGTGDLDTSRVGPLVRYVGPALTVLGASVLGLGLFGDNGNAAALVGIGAGVLFLGVAFLAPLLSRPVASVMGLLSRQRGIAGTLARNNAQRNPVRSALTAAALMIGVALVSFLSIFSSSATASIDQVFAEQFRADFIITNTSFGPIPLAVAEELREQDELAAVTEVRAVGPIAREDGSTATLTGMSIPEVVETADLQVVEGDLATLAVGEVFLRQDAAEELGLGVGDDFTFRTESDPDVSLTVAGLFLDEGAFSSPYLVNLEQWDALHAGADQLVLLRVADGATDDDGRTAVEDVLADYPGLQVQDQAELSAEFRGQIDTLLNLMIGLLFLAIVIALIGIVNTLALSIFERTREIGLLRAVGMTRSQVRTMIRWESVIVATFGALLGVGVGALLGTAMVGALPELEVLEFPAGRLVAYVVIAAFAGVIAAILPARRAARMDVLAAVTTE